MIPKALLISFLSISLPGQLSGVTRYEVRQSGSAVIDRVDITVGGSPGSVAEVSVPETAPAPLPANSVDVPQTPIVAADATDDYREAAITEIDFDKLPSGDWDPSKTVQGNVQFNAGSSGSGLRIWNVTYAFPALSPLPSGGTHALGNFPAGQSLGLRFTDGAHRNVTVSFGYVANQRLQAGFYQVSFSRGGRNVGNLRGQLEGRWARASSSGIAADAVSIFVAGGPPAGIVLLEYAEYDSGVVSQSAVAAAEALSAEL